MNALDHIKRFPKARTSTIARLIARDRMMESLIGFIVHRECEIALESELSKLLPEASRGDIERIEETY